LIGQTLSHYRITAALGAGGMGEVYRATDTTLGREVAIKILPPEVAKDPERLARFQREAHLLASLNHPNIAAIHGLEEAGERPLLVLELVECRQREAATRPGPVASVATARRWNRRPFPRLPRPPCASAGPTCSAECTRSIHSSVPGARRA